MRFIISPAKKMKTDTDTLAPAGLPACLDRAQELLDWMRKKSLPEMKAVWKCSDKIAQEAYERLEKTELKRNLTPALVSYEGIQYQYMAPAVFEDGQWDYVQEHVRILSGFYGILQPLDGVVPYRLEMQAKASDAGSLYAFWGRSLYERMAAETDCIVNLASREYALCVEKYLALFEGLSQAKDGIAYLADALGDFLEPEVKGGLQEIITSVDAAKSADFEMVFDAALVRGMSYYTGTIFEIAIPEFGGSCGGGGRYDKMVGKFTGNDVPACGFSIGFERIIMLLMENGFQVPKKPKQIAYLIEKGVEADALGQIIRKAQEARKDGSQVLVVRMNKNKKFQKEQLEKEGYEEFVEFYKNPLKN